jgi:hypothetical protein
MYASNVCKDMSRNQQGMYNDALSYVCICVCMYVCAHTVSIICTRAYLYTNQITHSLTQTQIRSMACKGLENAEASLVRRALVLAFTLRSSSYATMCIREILKEHSEMASLGLRETAATATATGDGGAAQVEVGATADSGHVDATAE